MKACIVVIINKFTYTGHCQVSVMFASPGRITYNLPTFSF